MTSGAPYLHDLHEAPLDPTELTLLTWLLKNVHSVDYAMADLSPSYVVSWVYNAMIVSLCITEKSPDPGIFR